jgi:L-alanine-DL-glutamate epimerase-like enolase superfamily enzyme
MIPSGSACAGVNEPCRLGAATVKITKLETIRLDEFPNLLWVHVYTDEGLVGLGETFFFPGRSRPMCMRSSRPSDRKRSARIDALSRDVVDILASARPAPSGGATPPSTSPLGSVRQSHRQPVAQLLGGFGPANARTYIHAPARATCAVVGASARRDYGLQEDMPAGQRRAPLRLT